MPHYTKPLPAVLDQLTALEVLPKLVWPLVRDQAKVGHVIPGNRITAGVDILFEGEHTTLTADQYEKFRTQVLIPITEQYLLKPFAVISSRQDIEKHARALIAQAFADD